MLANARRAMPAEGGREAIHQGHKGRDERASDEQHIPRGWLSFRLHVKLIRRALPLCSRLLLGCVEDAIPPSHVQRSTQPHVTECRIYIRGAKEVNLRSVLEQIRSIGLVR